MEYRWRRRVAFAAIAITGSLATAVPSALATMPGANGRIAYVRDASPGRPAVFVHGSGQLTDPQVGPPRDMDSNPAWSPDGQQVAFVRRELAGEFLIKVIDEDGTGERLVLSSAFFRQGTSPPVVVFQHPTWSRDGKRIAFSLHRTQESHQYDGIWEVNADGTGVSQLVRHYDVDSNLPARFPEWSPLGQELLYVCRFRFSGSTTIPDLCVLNLATRAVRQIRIDLPFGGRGSLRGPRWTPDGRKIVFVGAYNTTVNGGSVQHYEIFSVNPDGTGIKQLTDSPTQECPPRTLTTQWYETAAPSPDGEWIVAEGFAPSCTQANPHGIWLVPAGGGPGTPLIAPAPGENPLSQPDWQPLPADLTVWVDDGHVNPLKGLKLELRTQQGVILDDAPLNTAGGSYTFEGVGPGKYVLRATLVDAAGGAGAVPSFDVRYNVAPLEPVWIEQGVTIHGKWQQIVPLAFENSPLLTNSNLEPEDRDHLDDVANIYFRVRQFVDWVKVNLTADTGATVEFYTFASTDPLDGEPVAPNDANYQGGSVTRVVFGTAQSEYENRDGVQDAEHENTAPENGEWHEFTHHVYESFVRSYDCGPDKNHKGYRNADTCDSMSEGFAEFLPTLAAQAIDGVSDSSYDDMYHLETNWKAFSANTDNASLEEFAVAALYWDFVDASVETQPNQVIAQNGSHVPVVYSDATAMSLQSLWTQLTTAQPANVFDLRQSFGTPAITLDLDGVAPADVAPIDQVFLMHGFFPVEKVEYDRIFAAGGGGDEHKTAHYDVAAVQRVLPSNPRNSAVGLTNHIHTDESGAITASFIPREKVPLDPGANFEIDVRDASGTPLSGAELELAIDYPDLPVQTTSRRLGSGDAALVHLELPAYFEHLLPDGAPLPPCDPEHDVQVDVTVTATVNGYVSADTPQFDNCTYWHAIDAAAGPAALAFAVSFPEDSAPPVTTVATSASPPAVAGSTTGSWTVSLSCADPVEGDFASGCSRSEVRLDGGPITVYDEPILLAEAGQHTVDFRSVDAAANEEAFQSVALDILADCGDGLDNDGDGFVDFGQDDGCVSTEARSEIRVDLDFDGFVDEADRIAFSASFGRSAGNTAYLPEADFDGDQRITIVDFQSWLAAYDAYLAAQAAAPSCGLGIELLGVVAAARSLRRRIR
jgi:hypothetical protein